MLFLRTPLSLLTALVFGLSGLQAAHSADAPDATLQAAAQEPGAVVTASGLVADGASERRRSLSVHIRENGASNCFCGRSSPHDSHQLKPRIGLHDEGRGNGRTNSTSKVSRDDVNERTGICVVHK